MSRGYVNNDKFNAVLHCFCINSFPSLWVELPTFFITLFAAAWEGRFCNEDVDGCSEVTCFEGVQCFDIPAPGLGAVCGPCPIGYGGDGEKCSGKLQLCYAINYCSHWAIIIASAINHFLITDINECNASDTHNCLQVCVNTDGSFECSCDQGYQQIAGMPNHCEGQ